VRCGCQHAVVHFDGVIVELNQIAIQSSPKQEIDDFSLSLIKNYSFAVIVTCWVRYRYDSPPKGTQSQLKEVCLCLE
jgi:hypothetical protein